MTLIPMLCPCCNGNVEIPDDSNKFFCCHCGTQIISSYNDFKNIEIKGVVQVRNSDFNIQAGELKEYHGESVNVVIPNNIKKISTKCFENLMIETIKIPESVLEIGEEAFKGCIQLREIELPYGLRVIDAFLFQNCRSLVKIIIPETVTEIKKGAFNACISLKEVSIKGDNLRLIGEGAFCGCSSLVEIQLPDSLRKIEEVAFYRCKSLEKIILPDSLTEITKNMLGECTSLKKVDISSTCTKVYEYAFNNCTSLEEIIFPEGITKIENNALLGCTNLVNIKIPSSLKNIGDKIIDEDGKPYSVYMKSKIDIDRWIPWLMTLKNLEMVYCDETQVDYLFLEKNCGRSMHSDMFGKTHMVSSRWFKKIVKQRQDINNVRFRQRLEEEKIEKEKQEERQDRIRKKRCPECNIPLKGKGFFNKKEMICSQCGKVVNYAK